MNWIPCEWTQWKSDIASSYNRLTKSAHTLLSTGHVCNIFYSVIPHVDTHFCKGDLWITETALWEELWLAGLVSLPLLLLAPLKARGSEVAWRHLERLKLRFLLLTANTVGHTFLSSQNPPGERPCRPHERWIMAELAVMLAHLQAAVFFLFFFLLCSQQKSKGNQRAALTAVDKRQERPRHTWHWFLTEKIIWSHIKIIWRPLLYSGHNDVSLNGPFDQPLLWPLDQLWKDV